MFSIKSKSWIIVVFYFILYEVNASKHKEDESEQGRNVRRRSSKNQEKSSKRQTVHKQTDYDQKANEQTDCGQTSHGQTDNLQWNTNQGDSTIEYQPLLDSSNIFDPTYSKYYNYFNPQNIENSRSSDMTFLQLAPGPFISTQELSTQSTTGIGNIKTPYHSTNYIGEASNVNTNYQPEDFKEPEDHKLILKGSFGHCLGCYRTHLFQVNTKCSVCKDYFCADCFMRLHNLDELPIVEAMRKPKEYPDIVNCFHCGAELENKQKSLLYHLYRCTGRPRGTPLYTCCVCNKVYPKKYNIEKHFRVHSGEKPYICDYCNVGFSDASNFQRHIDRLHKDLAENVPADNTKNRISEG